MRGSCSGGSAGCTITTTGYSALPGSPSGTRPTSCRRREPAAGWRTPPGSHLIGRRVAVAAPWPAAARDVLIGRSRPVRTPAAHRPHCARRPLHLSAALACAVQGDHSGVRVHGAEAAGVAQRLDDRPDAFELFGPPTSPSGVPRSRWRQATRKRRWPTSNRPRRPAPGEGTGLRDARQGTLTRCRRYARRSGCHPRRYTIIR